MSAYREEDYLTISGIQHFCFCPRQWALIHVEQQWAENLLTVEGDILHARAHERDRLEKRGERYVTRAMPVSSARLGVSGILDVLEWQEDDDGISITGREGRYRPVPVEYKRGEAKEGKIGCSSVAKRCAWRRCSQRKYPEDTSFTVKRAGVKRWTFRRRCAHA